jgi:hypothetical protein
MLKQVSSGRLACRAEPRTPQQTLLHLVASTSFNSSAKALPRCSSYQLQTRPRLSSAKVAVTNEAARTEGTPGDEASKKFAIALARVADEVKCSDIVVLDVAPGEDPTRVASKLNRRILTVASLVRHKFLCNVCSCKLDQFPGGGHGVQQTAVACDPRSRGEGGSGAVRAGSPQPPRVQPLGNAGEGDGGMLRAVCVVGKVGSCGLLNQALRHRYLIAWKLDAPPGAARSGAERPLRGSDADPDPVRFRDTCCHPMDLPCVRC